LEHSERGSDHSAVIASTLSAIKQTGPSERTSVPRSSAYAQPTVERILLSVRGYLTSAFQGGLEGRRRAILLYIAVFWPLGLVAGYVFSGGHAVALALRLLGLTATLAWLLLRRRLSNAEWVVWWTIVVLAWFGAQYAVGPLYGGAYAVNGLGAFVVAAIVFDRWIVGYVAVIATCAYTVIQLHFHPTDKALVVAVMLVAAEVLVILLVGGTAHYLRDSLRDVNILHTRMAETADRERARIAGALHDDTLQVLTATGLLLDGLAGRLDRNETAGATDAVLQVRDMLQGASERTRRLSFDLYPTQLGDGGLGLAIDALGAQISGDDLQVEVDAPEARLPPEVERLAYRTIRELLLNARKHAQATRVVISVTADANRLHCLVADDGRGFDTATWDNARQDHHMGLDTTGERVRMAGGEFGIDSEPGRGTSASFDLPIHHERT
jgi:signal transduction histidine kinase